MNALELAERELAKGASVNEVAVRFALRRDQVQGIADVLALKAKERAQHVAPRPAARPVAPVNGDPIEAAFGRVTASIDELLENRNLAGVHGLLAAAREQLQKARGRLVEEQDKAVLRAEIEQLEAQLADRRQQLGEPVAGVPTVVVREWAARAGVECPARGRVPRRVLEAWRAAQMDGGGS